MTRLVLYGQLEGTMFCQWLQNFCELNRGVPPLKVNSAVFYCFVRKIKLSDRIMYVVVGKMTLKQTNVLNFANGRMVCWSKIFNDNEFVRRMWKGSRCPPSSCPFHLFISHVGVLFVRELVAWLCRSLAGERKRQRAWIALGGLQPTHSCSPLPHLCH